LALRAGARVMSWVADARRVPKRFLAKHGMYVGRLTVGDVMWLLKRTRTERLHLRYQEELEQSQQAMKDLAGAVKANLDGLLGPRG